MSLKNPVTPPGIDPGTIRLVAQRLNHYATPGPTQYFKYVKYQQLLTIYFGVYYTIFRETNALLALNLYAFCNVIAYVVLQIVQYTLIFQFTMLLQCLKQYVIRLNVS
jgi:hypothetical protein